MKALRCMLAVLDITTIIVIYDLWNWEEEQVLKLQMFLLSLMLLLNMSVGLFLYIYFFRLKNWTWLSICTGFHSLLFHLNVLSEILNDMDALVIFLNSDMDIECLPRPYASFLQYEKLGSVRNSLNQHLIVQGWF